MCSFFASDEATAGDDGDRGVVAVDFSIMADDDRLGMEAEDADMAMDDGENEDDDDGDDNGDGCWSCCGGGDTGDALGPGLLATMRRRGRGSWCLSWYL